MVHSKVFECFQEHLPAFAEKVETYFPNGKTVSVCGKRTARNLYFRLMEKKLGGLKLSTSFLQE